ncbi:hypothetical protein LJC16_03370, partial [Bacteroidales bacterium OttesenSCG-928-C19]|nr:hypothetical protein [Bacteroidales bacterium OttesenSCG-928-C19]
AQKSDLKANLNDAKFVVFGKTENEKFDVSVDFSSTNIAVKQPDLSAKLDNTKLVVSGEMKGNEIHGDLDFSIKNIFAQQGRIVYSRKLHLNLASIFDVDLKNGLYKLENTKLAINGLDFEADGQIQTKNFDTIDMDMNIGLHVPAIAVVKNLIPMELLPILNQYEVNGDILLNAKAKGTYAPEQLPEISASLLLKDGAVASGNLPMAFDDITLDVNAFVDFKDTKKSYANINNLEMYWPYSFLKVNGKARQILDDPKMNANIELASNLSEVKKYASFPEETDMNGELDIDLNVDFTLSDVMNMRLQKLFLSGNVFADKLLYSNPSDSLYVKADTLNIQFITNTSDEEFSSEQKLGKVVLFGQGIAFKQSEEINAQLAYLKGSVNIGSPNNDEITDARANISLNDLDLRMGDSLRLNSDKIRLKGSLRTEGEYNVSKAQLDVNLGKTKVELTPDRVDIEKMSFQLDVSPLTKSSAKYFSFSLAENTQADTLVAIATTAVATQETDYLQLFDSLLDEFDFNLLLDIKNVKVETDLIPLATSVPSFNISLNKDVLTFLDTRVNMGNSNVALSGYINNIQSVIFDKGVVKGNINLSSDLIDGNELMYAFVFADSENAPSETEDAKKALQQALDTISLLITIPPNVNVGVNTNIKQLLFNKANFKDVTGRIVMRNQHALLDNLTLISELGEIKILMLYEATSNKKATAAVDLYMNKVDIKKLIETIPMVDTMLPMLKSFEGILDCQVVAKTEFDSKLNINFPETQASCYLHGKDLVLLSGKQFKRISNWLFFKNKKRNLIDSLSVELYMSENAIVFFPFPIQLDRYRAIVGGKQNADKSFEYYISLINSPLPFRLGLNLKGNPDKMKFYPFSKVKYKQLAKNSNSQISLNHSNTRKQLYAAILKKIKDIIYAPDDDDMMIGPMSPDAFLLDVKEEIPQESE